MRVRELGQRAVIVALVTIGFSAPAWAGEPAATDGPWKLAKSGGGVQVFTRARAGSSMKEFRAVTRLRTSLSSVIALLDDVSSYTGWFADCKENRLLRTISPRERYTYFVMRAPFPVSDRDMVIHYTLSQDPGSRTVVIRLRGEPGYYPEQRGRVRVPKLDGGWRLTPGKDGFVDVQYQMHSEPGGSIPDWLANSAVADAPLKTLRNLSRLVANQKYAGARLDFITE